MGGAVWLPNTPTIRVSEKGREQGPGRGGQAGLSRRPVCAPAPPEQAGQP